MTSFTVFGCNICYYKADLYYDGNLINCAAQLGHDISFHHIDELEIHLHKYHSYQDFIDYALNKFDRIEVTE